MPESKVAPPKPTVAPPKPTVAPPKPAVAPKVEVTEPENHAKVINVRNNTDKIINTSQGCIAINGKGKATIAELMLHAGFLERI